MKNNGKFFGVIVILLIIGFLFSACDTGTSNNGEDTTGKKVSAIGLDCISYTFDTRVDSSKSARSMQQGSVYGFTIIKPIQGGSGFEPEVISVTVQSISALGNGKEKITLKRSDTGGIFTITLDANGEMVNIQGLAGCKDGYLTPFVNNANNLDGAWVGYKTGSQGDIVFQSITIKGNELWNIADEPGGQAYSQSDFNYRTDPTPAIITYKTMQWIPDEDIWEDVTNDLSGTTIGTYRYQFSTSNPSILDIYIETQGDLHLEFERYFPSN